MARRPAGKLTNLGQRGRLVEARTNVHHVLEVLGLKVTKKQAAIIDACFDLATLERRPALAITATSSQELFVASSHSFGYSCGSQNSDSKGEPARAVDGHSNPMVEPGEMVYLGGTFSIVLEYSPILWLKARAYASPLAGSAVSPRYPTFEG